MNLTKNGNDTAVATGTGASPPVPAPLALPEARPSRKHRVGVALLNAFSLSRFGFAAAFPLVDTPTERVALISAAALSDFLDGWIARHAHLATRLGAIIDPIADRAFVLTALSTYLGEHSLAPGQYGLLLVRDLATGFGTAVAWLLPSLRRAEIKARPLGKIVTTLQLATLLAVPLAPRLVRPLVIAAGVTAFLSVIDYARATLRARTRGTPLPLPRERHA